MEDEKIQIQVAQGVTELTIRHGDAAKVIVPSKTEIKGNINAVYDFIKTRASTLDKLKCVIIFSESTGVLTLSADPSFPESNTVVIAQIEEFEDLKAFGINKEKYYNLKDIEKFIRMNRFWFNDKDDHFKLSGQLKSFSAKVQSELQQEADNRGNKNNSFKKQVTSDLAADFVLNIPIYKGCKYNVFRVEICYDVTDSQARFWLESVELFELQKTALNESFSSQVDEIKAMGFTVITQ